MAARYEFVTILMAEDDPDDRELIRDVFAESGLQNELRFVESGEELMDYLRHRNRYAEPASAPAPGLILLDLNMPGMGGRESLEHIKNDPELRHIPVVVLTTSRAEEDVVQSYRHGASSYITKPATFSELVRMARNLQRYWLRLVRLPFTNGAAER